MLKNEASREGSEGLGWVMGPLFREFRRGFSPGVRGVGGQ